ncbi:hypothetical protein R3P38DRAFT_2851281 [Favolaschia claudopus]|uniref:Cytochrome c oxidase subunit VIIc n=1 Tax=Favolaschia claudopus TaxID=2862362 RepID=A0AAW0DNE7_9AGAR
MLSRRSAYKPHTPLSKSQPPKPTSNMTSLVRSSVAISRHLSPAVIRQPLASATTRRFAHAHAAEEYHNMPFDYSNRRRFAAKCIAYMGFGFALPFVAVGWQWYKPGGYKNPL